MNLLRLPIEFYNGKPGEYFSCCAQCKKSFIGDKRDYKCPKCKNNNLIVSAYRDSEGWVLFNRDEEPISCPEDWPSTFDSKFLEDRGIKIM